MKKSNNGKGRGKAKADKSPKIDEVFVEDISEAVTGEFQILHVPEPAANPEADATIVHVAMPELAHLECDAPTVQVAVPEIVLDTPREADAPPAQVNGAVIDHVDPPQRSDSERAAFLLSHLESEIARLHEKWHGIDAEFKARETRIAQLRDEVQSRDSALEKLAAELRSEQDALAAAEQRVLGKDQELAALMVDQRARDERIEKLLAESEAAEQRQRSLGEKVVATETELARVTDRLHQEQARVADVIALNEGVVADKQQLQSKVQDLETYIDGRHRSWSDLQTELGARKDALGALEKAVRARDESIARHDEEQKRVAARILDLERECSELAGRRKEREAAHDEVQTKLARQLVLAEQLKAEHANRLKETEQASANAVSNQKLVESLQRGMERRDESLAELTATLEKHQSAAAELATSRDKLAHRVDELERNVQDRVLQVQTLRDESRTAHEELRVAQQQLAERSTHLAASQQAAEEKARLVEKLSANLRTLESEMVAARSESARLAERAADAARSYDDARDETERLKAEAAVQRELIASLEAELGKKQAAADLLERNVGRITDLQASMAALDRRLDQEAGGYDPAVIDVGGTLASDEPPDSISAEERLPGEAAMPTSLKLDRIHPGAPEGRGRARRFIMLDGGGEIDYPLVKNQITIGRGQDNDIRIASQFISRVHARVSTQGVRTVIEDAGSKNGILVNSERVRRRVLHDGDVVSLGGELNLKFVDGAPAAPPGT